jgi:hypothetical protein
MMFDCSLSFLRGSLPAIAVTVAHSKLIKPAELRARVPVALIIQLEQLRRERPEHILRLGDPAVRPLVAQNLRSIAR